MIQEAGGDDALFAAAAEHYARNVAEQVETLVVIPIWDEIERFNSHARRALRRRGLLGDVEVVREAVKPLSWTEEQKQHWGQYQPGDRLLFVRDTRFFRRGTVPTRNLRMTRHTRRTFSRPASGLFTKSPRRSNEDKWRNSDFRSEAAFKRF